MGCSPPTLITVTLDTASCAVSVGIQEGFKLSAVNLGGLRGRGRFYAGPGTFVQFIGK